MPFLLAGSLSASCIKRSSESKNTDFSGVVGIGSLNTLEWKFDGERIDSTMDVDAAERLTIVILLTGIGPMVPNAGAPLILLTVVETWVDVGWTAEEGDVLRSAAIKGFGDIADVRELGCSLASFSPLAEDGQWL